MTLAIAERRKQFYQQSPLAKCPHCGEKRNRIDEVQEWDPRDPSEVMCPRRERVVGWECEGCGDFEDAMPNPYEDGL